MKCFFMNDKLGNCNGFVSDDFTSEDGIVLALEEAVEFQKKHPNKKILVYDTTDKKLVEHFTSIGGMVTNS